MILKSVFVFLCFIQIQEVWLSEYGVSVTRVEEGKEDLVWSVNLPSSITWWKLDMEANYLVSEIHIVYGNSTEKSKPSHKLAIYVASREGDEQVCITVSDSLDPWNRPNSMCVNHPRYACYVIIKRPDGMHLAEIKVFAKKVEKEGAQPIFEKSPSREYPGLVKESYVELKRYATKQGGTWNSHSSWLAVDGDLKTYSVACVTCDHGLSGGPGWWQVDLGRERAVAGIMVITSDDHYNAQYFNDVQIFLGSTSSTDPRDARMCYDFSSNDSYPASHRFDFRCRDAPLIGRFLTIKRKRSAKFRPDALSLAEVKILENYDHSATMVLENNSAVEATVQRPIDAIQSGTWDNHHAGLALDGNTGTWSIADTSQDSNYQGLTAWWQADFGSLRTLTDLSITSSTDEYNAMFLKDISVEVSNSSASVTSNGFVQCNFYRGNIIAGQRLNLKCHKELYGRFVIIRRVSKTEFRPDALTLAEVSLSYY